MNSTACPNDPMPSAMSTVVLDFKIVLWCLEKLVCRHGVSLLIKCCRILFLVSSAFIFSGK